MNYNIQASACTAGCIEPFKKGWAVFGFVGSKAHYWIEDVTTMPPTINKGGRVRYYRSVCGCLGTADKRVPPFYRGSYPKCKNCLRRHPA